MPTSASARRTSANAGAGLSTARPSAAPLPPQSRRPAPPRQPSASPPTAARRGSVATELLPIRRDSSIGATSSNPRLRRGSVIEAAAAVRSSSAPRHNLDFSSSESKEALSKLRQLLAPLLRRVLLRRRRQSRWHNRDAPRHYTPESVVAAITSSKSLLSEWPLRVLERLADGASFHTLGPKEYIVYANESHVSCGVVVLLHGQLEERRPEAKGKGKGTGGGSSGASSRPIRTQTHRLHKATDVLCVMPVLCEDRATSSLVTREKEEADVAIINSRWFWEVCYSVAQSSLPASEALVRVMRDVVPPHRRDVVLADYYPTSVVLLRSWMWPLLTASDRVKLCRSMEVRVIGVGESLYDEGEYCPYIYVVRRGTLTVMVKGEALAMLEAGACIGEESVLFHEKRNSTVVAATMCELYALHVRHLEHRLVKYPEVGQRIIAAALERQKQWMEQGKTRDVFGLVSILSGVPCLGHTTDTMREELAQCATVRTLPQGFVLATTNTPCTSFLVIGRGTVALTSVVKPPPAPAGASTSDVAASTANGRNGSTPPRPRGSSMANSTNPRKSLAASRSGVTPGVDAAPLEVRRETRSAGDFVGELCLKPHLWPFDVVCESTVNVWQFDRDAVLQVLEKNRADAQAIEVCRKGISLYRAQRGEASITEGFDAPATPTAAGSSHRPSAATRRASRAPSPQNTAARGQRGSSASSRSALRLSVSQLGTGDGSPLSAPPPSDSHAKQRSPRESSAGPPPAAKWTAEQWTSYALARVQEEVKQENEKEAADGHAQALAAPTRELRDVDKEVEKAMKEKVLQLIAVQPTTPPNPADCDISGDGEELQAIIVEQLFLIPTERQPRFIRQVNDSNVRLVTEEDESHTVGMLDDDIDEEDLKDRWRSDEAPISVSGVMRLEDVNDASAAATSAAAGVAASREDSDQIRTLASYSFQGGSGDSGESSGVRLGLVGEPLEMSGQVGWAAGLGRSRRSISGAALEDSGAGFMNSLNPRTSISRSHFVRPPSGLPVSPRNTTRSELISPRGTSALRPTSSSEPRVIPPTRVRPTSVDYNQFNKIGVDRSTSVLDRYVKIEDQNYFDNFVKVLPLQQDEIWAPDDVNTGEDVSTGSMILLLMHVRKCDYLTPEVMQRCQRPIVKVTLGQRVLIRTSVMENATSPRWPIEKSSFISFVRRGIEIVFSVCDADDEDTVVYRTILSTASIHENGGVGQRAMSLTELSATGSPVAADAAAAASAVDGADAASTTSSKKSHKGSSKKPRLTTTMLAVTASKYKALRQYLETREERVFDAPTPSQPDTTTLFLQVMSVEGLKHRVEAAVSVSLYNGGSVRQLLETNQVVPKTRSPAWAAEKAFVRVCADGGVLTFDLQHKGSVISSAEATIDELAFGGVGLRRLPLLQAQTGSTVMGQLVVCMLGANVGGGVESQNRDWVTHVAVEELNLAEEGFAITPDPFVVLRDGAGEVKMRTPLACGSFRCTWPMSEASCLLSCPRLSGSTAVYHFEVCDSDEHEVIGRATITVTERGLRDSQRREIALDPPGSGVLRLRSHCLPVMELPAGSAGAAASGGASTNGAAAARSSLTQKPPTPTASSSPAHRGLPSSAALLLLHVSGCTDLPGGASEEYQTDAISTFAIDAHQLLRTSLQEGTTSPRWPFSKASIVLHIPPAVLEEMCNADDGGGKQQHRSSPSSQHHECRFGVYDGVVDPLSQIGQVAVPLLQLLSSSVHTYPLFPRLKDVAQPPSKRASESASQSVPLQRDRTAVGFVPPSRVAAAERTVGQIQVSTLFGRLDQQVDAGGLTDAGMEAEVQEFMMDGSPSSLPYYNPEGTDGAAVTSATAAAKSSAKRAATVLLSVSNVCHVLPNASAKYIHLIVRHGETRVLTLECQMGVSSHKEWNPAEASVALPRASLTATSDGVLAVELRAVDVREISTPGDENREKEEEEDGTTTAAPSATNRAQHARRPSSSLNGSLLIGAAELPAAKLAAVEAGEVEVVTLQLEAAAVTAEVRNGNAKADPNAEAKPTVSFCIIGNRV